MVLEITQYLEILYQDDLVLGMTQDRTSVSLISCQDIGLFYKDVSGLGMRRWSLYLSIALCETKSKMRSHIQR